MKKKFLLMLAGMLLSCLISFSSVYAEKTYELKFSHMSPAGSTFDKTLRSWAKKLEAESKGQLKIRVYPGGVLVNAFATYESVAKGVVDIGGSFRYSRKGAELTGLISMFFAGIPDAATGSRILDEIDQKFPQWRAEWQETKPIFIIAYGPASLITKPKQIANLENLQGLQMRVPVREAADMLKALGGVPVGMRLGDFLVGMKKGTVDGGSTQLYSLRSFKLSPTARYCTLFSLYNPSNYFLTMNLNSFNRLPSNLQRIINNSREWARAQMIAAVDRDDAEGMAFARKNGMKFTTLSPAERKRWFDIIGPEQDKMAAHLDAKGYPATAVLKFVRTRMDHYIK